MYPELWEARRNSNPSSASLLTAAYYVPQQLSAEALFLPLPFHLEVTRAALSADVVSACCAFGTAGAVAAATCSRDHLCPGVALARC